MYRSNKISKFGLFSGQKISAARANQGLQPFWLLLYFIDFWYLRAQVQDKIIASSVGNRIHRESLI